VDKVVKAFKALNQYPSPTSARIMNAVTGSSGVTVLSSWSQTNLERGKSIKFQQTHFVDSVLKKVLDMTPVDTSSEYVEFSSVIMVWFTVCRTCVCCDKCCNSNGTPGRCKQRPRFMLAVLVMGILML
jgi:hypothetical protein